MVSGLRNEPPYPLLSVDNALRLILELQTDEEVRLSEAAVRLGIANSTAHRLLSMLVYRGFAVQTRSRAYRRGPAFFQTAPTNLDPASTHAIHAALLDLVAEVDETCHFVVLEGNGLRFVDGVAGSRSPRVGIRTGTLLPAHTNSGGKALLARLPNAELRALYPRGLRPDLPGAVNDLGTLRQEFTAIRRRGYGLNVDESRPGLSGVGRQVAGPAGDDIGALVIGVPSVRGDRRALTTLAKPLLAAVAGLEVELKGALR